MKHSTKVLLLSALVFPGLGHFKVRRPKTGLALIFATILFSSIMIYQGVVTATKILEDFMNQNNIEDVTLTKLFEITRQALESNDFTTIQLSLYALIATYVFSCWHSYELAKDEELNRSSSDTK